jgi:hypothetical protein
MTLLRKALHTFLVYKGVSRRVVWLQAHGEVCQEGGLLKGDAVKDGDGL